MKYIFVALLILTATACTSKTEFGDCIGAFDEKDPSKVYKVSGMNIFWGAVGAELFFIPPIMVIKDQTLCPIGNKAGN